MERESDLQKRSNMGVARTVYMYILIVGALALMSTTHFSFDVLTVKHPDWSSVVLFWLTLLMLSGAYYLFDRTIRNARWFSVLMAILFLMSVAYPFYTLSDPRLMVIRMLTGMVVMVAMHSLYNTVARSLEKTVEDRIRPKSPSPRERRGVNNFTRMRGSMPITDSRYALEEHRREMDEMYARKDEELAQKDNRLMEDIFDVFKYSEEEDRELQRMIDALLAEPELGTLSDRMERVRKRREQRERMNTKRYVLDVADLKRSREDTADDKGVADDTDRGEDKEE